MAPKKLTYLAYLLRFWRESETAPWRVSLQSPGSIHPEHFATPAAAYAFLQQQLAPGAGEEEVAEDAEG